jgi:phosphoglycerate dehydrogenase-like enzyme
MLRNQQARRWEQFDVEEIHGQTLGIIGYGEIGRSTAIRAHAFGMKILGVRRRPELSKSDAILDEIHSFDQRADVIGRSDYVLAAAPLTPETRGLIGETELRAMKSTGVILNLGRGPVIDEPALIRALEDRRIRGAALDVFDQEPLPESHPFWGMENVLLSPHCADHTATWLFEAMEFFVANFERFRAGEPLANIVDKNAGY